jgi:hypothetical protein
MDFLEQTIHHLNEEERADFRYYLQRQKSGRKDLQLFELLCKTTDWKPRDLVAKLYSPINMNAYHSLRKRLMHQLLGHIVHRRLRDDVTEQSNVLGMISMSQFMLEKNANEAAQYFIQRAEQLAEKNARYDLLDHIYNVQIAHADKWDFTLDEVVEKWQANTDKYKAHQKLNIAYALIRNQLAEARKAGTTLDPEEIIQSVFHDFDISVNEANNPAFMHRLVAMMRSAIVSTKDYHRLEPFLVRVYKRMKKVNAFQKGDQEYELGFLYMMAHVYYRNRKFDEASQWLETMSELVPLRSFKQSIYYPKWIALKAAVASYSGNNRDAITTMKDVWGDKQLRLPTSEKLNMQLNLAVYYFQSAEYKKANKTMMEIGHSDKWLEEKMGKEWRFKKNMIELIIQYELGNDDIALSRIRTIEKQFSEFFSHPAYQRARLFLRFIKRLALHPDAVASEKFTRDVEEAQMGWPGHKEDIQAITFFCWLKSKMVKRDYYEVLLETVRTTPSN